VQVTPTVSTLYSITGGTGACSSTTVIVVLVNPSLPLNVMANPAVVCAGQPVILQAGGPPTVTWQPGGLTGNQVTVTPLATTIYTATRSNPVGCSRSQTLQVTVNPLPVINVSGGINGVCSGQPVTLTASGANSYTWQPGGHVFASIVVTPTATTVYTVSGGAPGCTNSAVYVLAVTPASPPSISVSQSVICSGAPVVLSGGGAASYTWLPGNLSGQSVTVTPVATTVYTLIAQSVQGCIGRASASVLVQEGAFISVSHPTSVCAGSEATITLSGAQNYSLNGNPTGGTGLVLSPTISATYTVLGEGPGNCADTAFFSIDVIQTPVFHVSQNSTIICSGSSATLSASGAVNWLPMNITGSNVVVVPKVTTTYTAHSGNGNCTYSAAVTLSVIDCPEVLFGVTNAAGPALLSEGNKYAVGYTVTVVNQSSIALTEVTLRNDLAATFPYPCTYTIQGLPRLLSHNSGLQVNSNFNGANEISLVIPSTSTLLAEKVDTIALAVLIEPRAFSGTTRNWVVGSARTLWNDIVSDSSNSGFKWDPDKDGDPTNNNDPTIVELKMITLFVPEAFSPDGDGRYDELIIKGMQGRSALFTVYNRWGSKVYESTGSEVRWDGYANSGVLMGKGKLPPATYYYVLQFTDGEKETIRGYVVISY
jgi:gliding motility-associated-like protein